MLAFFMLSIENIRLWFKTPRQIRCIEEIEQRGGSHSWWKQCDLPSGHEGRCTTFDYDVSVSVENTRKKQISIGTFNLDLEAETKERKRKILALQEQSYKLALEIQEIETLRDLHEDR
jgi:hypothetical protein